MHSSYLLAVLLSGRDAYRPGSLSNFAWQVVLQNMGLSRMSASQQGFLIDGHATHRVFAHFNRLLPAIDFRIDRK
jgi:hypothetical protein